MNYRQIYARKAECEKRIKEVCPDCPNTSGIYFILREEDGFRYGYIGKARHLLERLGQHLIGYQHIDLSIKKHGLWSEENQTGYKIHFLQFPENELDEKERYFIQKYANSGWQMRNVEIRINLSAGFQAQAIFIMPQMYSQTVGSSNYIQWNVAFFADIGSNIGVFSCVQSQQTIYIITNTQYGYIPNNNGVVYNYVAIGYKS